MKHYLQFGGLMLGVALATGCGAKLEPAPAPTAQDEAAQAAQMEESMKAGEAAAAAAAGGGTDASGAASAPDAASQ